MRLLLVCSVKCCFAAHSSTAPPDSTVSSYVDGLQSACEEISLCTPQCHLCGVAAYVRSRHTLRHTFSVILYLFLWAIIDPKIRSLEDSLAAFSKRKKFSRWFAYIQSLGEEQSSKLFYKRFNILLSANMPTVTSHLA